MAYPNGIRASLQTALRHVLVDCPKLEDLPFHYNHQIFSQASLSNFGNEILQFPGSIPSTRTKPF